MFIYLRKFIKKSDNIARTCPFFGQLWYNDHPKDENNVYIFKEIYKKK